MKKLIFLILLLSIGLTGFSQDNFFGTYNQKLPTAQGGVYFDCQGGMYCTVGHVNNGGYAIKAAGYLVGVSSSTSCVLGHPLLQLHAQLNYPVNYQSSANSGTANFYEGDYYTNRYYVITSMDDTIYGNVTYAVAPTCTSANPPTVQTCLGYPDVTGSTATVCGQVLSDGDGTLSGYGIVYSQTSPALANYASGDGTPYLGYNSTMTGLIPGTTYYYRAFGRNEHGYGYGTEYSFVAGSPYTEPTVSTDSVVNITLNSATLYGNIINDGGDGLTASGFVWNNTGNPTTSDNTIDLGTSTGIVSYGFSGSCGDTVYFRTFATNSIGTSYGSDIQFNLSTIEIYPLIPALLDHISSSCGTYYLTNEASVTTMYNDIKNNSCTSKSWGGYAPRAESFTTGKQLYSSWQDCTLETFTGWFLVYYPATQTGYKVYVSNGVIQSITQL